MTDEQQLALASALAEVDPASVQGFALVVDTGSPQATVITNLEPSQAGAMLSKMATLLATGNAREAQ